MERPYSPLLQLTLARVREFYREPAAVFWVYGFPLLMALALGTAFRDRPVEKIGVDLVETEANAAEVAKFKELLERDPRMTVQVNPPEDWKKRLRSGKSDLVVSVGKNPSGETTYEVWDERNRPESVLARNAVENVAAAAAGQGAARRRPPPRRDRAARYIDFLVPGLIGMNLMGGGLFGVGFVIVDMRVRKLLKRFLATPMKRTDFLFSIMLSRLLFTVPEILMLLGFGYLAFDVKNAGSFLDLMVVILAGGVCFAGVGLLIACRAKTIETASGLMNLAMLPMYVLSGVFFSSERFPEAVQPFIKALPLTALNDALRAVMLEAKSLPEAWPQLAVLAAWGGISFVLALKLFRWK